MKTSAFQEYYHHSHTRHCSNTRRRDIDERCDVSTHRALAVVRLAAATLVFIVSFLARLVFLLLALQLNHNAHVLTHDQQFQIFKININ